MIPALVNHLWQSTLFAISAGLLTLMVRRNGAAVRYGLWFAASVKFLIPFALLAAAGGLVVERLHVSLPAPQSLQAIAPVIAPMAPPKAAIRPAPLIEAAPEAPTPATRPVVPGSRQPASSLDPMPVLLAAWMLGLAGVLLIWTRRWSHIRAALRAARPSRLPAPVPVLCTPFPMEPGVVGLRYPVVIVPEGIAEQLSPPEWRALLAHELGHIHRRDNLTGLIHMLVQALFWFHPLVWWLGARLVAERELACDEAVLRAGHDRRAYARSLVESARLYVQSPLGYAAGASGVDLKTRVKRIMTAPVALPLSHSKKALLLAAASFGFATPVAAGLLTPQARLTVQPLAKAMAAIAAPAQAFAVAAPDQGEAAKPVILARNDAVPAPTIAVAVNDAAPHGLAQTDAAPRADQAPAEDARPIEVAALAPTPAPAPSTSVALERVETLSPQTITAQARNFVQSYATAPNPELGQIARWHTPVCVQIEGLAQAAQSSQVKARIESVAQAVGVPAARPGCQANVEIVFTDTPQRTLDDLAKRREDLLGYYHRRDRDRLKAVSRPIQAWYKTATLSHHADAGLEFPGFDQDAGAGSIANPAGAVRTDDPEVGLPNGCGDSPRFTKCLSSQFSNVFIVVDSKALQGKSLGQVGEYLVMLALSQPKPLDGCAPLPSILDLTAKSSCPGGGRLDGLTPADAAWLTSLYATDSQARGDSQRSDIAARMATMLTKATSAAR